MRKIKGVLITPNQGGTNPRKYEMEYKNYKSLYPVLECDTFTIADRKFNGEYFSIYCDDEGLFKEGNKPSIITLNESGSIVEQIVGNAFICKHNEEGDIESLTDEEVEMILKTVTTAYLPDELVKVCVTTI